LVFGWDNFSPAVLARIVHSESTSEWAREAEPDGIFV